MESFPKTFQLKILLLSDVRRVFVLPSGLLFAEFLPAELAQPLTPGTTAAWGSNAMALGQTIISRGLNNVTAFAAESLRSLTLKGDSTVAAWRNRLMGQTRVPSGLSSVKAVAAGAYHSLALQTDRTVIGWSDNSYDESRIPVGLTNVTFIAAGRDQSLAPKGDGTAVGWGDSRFGEATLPTRLTGVTALAAVGFFSLAGNLTLING